MHGSVSLCRLQKASSCLINDNDCQSFACKQLLHNGKPISSDARDLAGGVMLNMAVAAHELKRHSPVELCHGWDPGRLGR